LAFIGWFIFAASREEETRISTQQVFTGVRVADAMTTRPHTAPRWITVEDFIQRYVLGDRHSAYPVADRDGSIVGLVTLAQLRDVAPHRRTTTSVGDIALPLHAVPSAAPEEPLTGLLERMAPAGPRSRALVIDGSGVVGIITPSDLTRLMDVYRLAKPGPAKSAHR
jgi:CBS domain-containing protein